MVPAQRYWHGSRLGYVRQGPQGRISYGEEPEHLYIYRCCQRDQKVTKLHWGQVCWTRFLDVLLFGRDETCRALYNGA